LEDEKQELQRESEKVSLEIDHQREKKDEDSADLHQKQLESENAKIEKEKFDYDQFKQGEKQIQQDLVALETKKKRINKDIKNKLKTSPLKPEDTVKVEKEKAVVKKISELIKQDKEVEEFYQSGAPMLAEKIIKDEIQVVDIDLKNKETEIQTKKEHEDELKKEIDKVNQDIQQMANFGNDKNFEEQADLQVKQKREKQLETILKEEKEDENLLKKEIDSSKKIKVQLSDLQETEVMVAGVVGDRVVNEKKLEELKESPKEDKKKLKNWKMR